jgi:PAS domain S-box-containing protein
MSHLLPLPPDSANPDAEIQHLKQRVTKLIEEKSYFQLLLQLMEHLNPLSGLDDMIQGLLYHIVESIGGTNIRLYFWLEDELHYVDFLGTKKILDTYDDAMVREAAERREFVQLQGVTDDALLMHGMLRGSWTWAFPLLIGQQLIGVIKLENLHIHGAALGKYLPLFFSHAALILGNEIRNTVQHRSETALRVATERLQLATEAGFIGVWDWDIEQNKLFWDASMYRLYGKREGEFGGAYEAWAAAVHPDDKAFVEGEIQAGLRGEREYAPEFRVVWPDGSVHHLKAASRTSRDVAGKPLRMVGINYDQTEIKRAEQERLNHLHFLESLDRVNRAIQGAGDLHAMLGDVLQEVLAIFACDRVGLVNPCDPNVESWQVMAQRARPGYGVEEGGTVYPMNPDRQQTMARILAASAPLRFGPQADFPVTPTSTRLFQIQSMMTQAIRPKVGPPWEFGIHQCDRPRVWSDEELRLFQEIGRRLGDAITSLLIQQELRDGERRLKEAERIAHVGYWERDLVNNRILLSDESYRIFGLSPEQPFKDLDDWNRRWLTLIHPDDRPQIARAVSEAIAGGPSYDVEYRVIRPDGEMRIVHSQADIPLDVAGQPRRILGSMQDITERKQSEAELEQHRHHLEELVETRTRELAQARDTAESANRMKSAFLANMSHELRTPLNAILGFAQILERDTRIPADRRANLATINRSGKQLLALINDVLEISRIEAGRLTLQPATCELHELLTGLAEVVEFRASKKGLRMSMTRSPDLPRYIEADAGKLRQILLNLLTNAVKYTEHGSIELSAKAEIVGDRATLMFSVSDTGVGIAAEDLQRIFQPFYQTTYGVRLGEGTGLGLTICREYSDLMGGKLSVESELHGGTCFHLSLPVQLADEPESVAPALGRVLGLAPEQPPCRVLVAEDNADSRQLLCEILERAGFQVRAVVNGAEAVSAFQDWSPQFIWMDMRMPVLDGYAATRRIRDLPGGKTVRIVALTASAFREDHADILAAGCDSVVAKPLVEAQLFEEMGRLLGLRYRYEEAPTTVRAENETTHQAQLPEPLPAELLTQLREAAHMLDIEATNQFIARIGESQPELARQLQQWSDEYRFDRIVALCEQK